MSKIIVKFSSIVITDYNMGDCKALERYFTLWDKVRHCTYIYGIVYDEDKKELLLPRGLDVFLLEKYFDTKAIYEKKSDPFDKRVLEGIKIKYAPRDEQQKEALQFMTASGAYHNMSTATGQLVSLGTGKGKTYCSIVASVIHGYRTMVITSSIEWLKQWNDCILDYCSNINQKEVYTISGAHTIYRLFNDNKIHQYKYFLVSDSTLRSYAENYGWDKVAELFKFLRIGLKIYDECHLHFDAMSKIDYYSNTYLTYYLSATPMRSNSDEDRVFQLYFKNIPKLNIFNPDEDPHTDYISIRFNSKPTIDERESCGSYKYGLDRNKYINYLTKNKNFYKLMKYIMKIIGNQKTLIFIGTQEGIDRVHEWIVENYPQLSDEIGIYTSVIPKDVKAEMLNKQIILSTTKSAGTAKDIKGLKNTVVLAEPFKSEVLAKQTLGRTRDKDTRYIDIIDIGFDQLKRYYSHKLKVYKKYALSIKEIKVSQDELNSI